jgi:hypothetical protein
MVVPKQDKSVDQISQKQNYDATDHNSQKKCSGMMTVFNYSL